MDILVATSCEVLCFVYSVEMCLQQTCSGEGNCYGAGDSYVCVCNEGRYGLNCEFEGPDPCRGARRDCHGNGNCTFAENGNHQCHCHSEDFEGLFECRELKPFRNECMSYDPCENDGQCIATAAFEYECDCPPGKIYMLSGVT